MTQTDQTPTRTLITSERIVSTEVEDALWEGYRQTFSPLEEVALLSHLYDEESFRRLVQDPTIVKFVGWAQSEPVGCALITNNLSAVPQISPAFLHAQYPHAAARDAVFFGIAMFVLPTYRGRTLFARLLAECAELARQADGVAVVDICDHNERTVGVSRHMAIVAEAHGASDFRRIDAQYYYAFEFPGATAE